MSNIENLPVLFETLNKLKADTIPVFGKMTAQHMVEHLAWTVTFSNGKFPQKLVVPEDKIESNKLKFLHPGKEYPMGVKSLLLSDKLPELKFPYLQNSINSLHEELVDFHKYFELNKDSKPLHASMGALDHRQWILFHNKHFMHHFKQFNLA